MWIKDVILELAVTCVIALAAIGEMSWAVWVVIIYTPLLLLFKLIAVFAGGLLRSLKGGADAVPAWFWHANYAANVLLLLIGQLWLLAAGWALIWILSVVYDARRRTPA